MAFPSESKQFPLLALRDVVVYPHMVIPLFVGREKSIKALEEAMETDKQIVLVAQVNASDDDPAPSDLYQVGTIATILQLLKLPDGTVKVLVEGANRAFTKNVILDNGYLKAEPQMIAQNRLEPKWLRRERAMIHEKALILV